jgi:phosphatidate phosphatase APP1
VVISEQWTVRLALESRVPYFYEKTQTESMASIRKKLLRAAAGAEQKFDDLVFELRQRLGMNDPIQLVTYRSYGTVNNLYVKGRVLEDKSIRKSSSSDSVWRNIAAMYRRFESDEVPGATLSIDFGGEQHTVVSNKEGYFVKTFATKQAIPWEDMWHEVEVRLTEAPIPFREGLSVRAEVLVPPPDAEYGVISDIDDTIVKTGATSLLAMSRNTFFHNAHTRLPFAGVAEFYKALLLGRNGKRNNPFFYVSSSPWNVYDLLIEFMDLNDIPPGPLLLRDFGLDADKAGSSDHMGHKLKEIEQILNAYPHLPFVLIGDSGQEDPAIYYEVVKKYPGRILAVYIRDVKLPQRHKLALDISKEVAGHKVEMLIVENTVQAAEHAAANSLIFTEAMPVIERDRKQDEGELPGKEEMTVDVTD